MAFKLGNRNNTPNTPSRKPMLFKKRLEKGVIAEANNYGTIYIDESVKPNSKLYNRAVKHEQAHIDQMESGRSDYGDNWVMWEDKIYIRKNGMIDGPAGRLPEGHPDHPWEQEAINAEKE